MESRGSTLIPKDSACKRQKNMHPNKEARMRSSMYPLHVLAIEVAHRAFFLCVVPHQSASFFARGSADDVR